MKFQLKIVFLILMLMESLFSSSVLSQENSDLLGMPKQFWSFLDHNYSFGMPVFDFNFSIEKMLACYYRPEKEYKSCEVRNIKTNRIEYEIPIIFSHDKTPVLLDNEDILYVSDMNEQIENSDVSVRKVKKVKDNNFQLSFSKENSRILEMNQKNIVAIRQIARGEGRVKFLLELYNSNNGQKTF